MKTLAAEFDLSVHERYIFRQLSHREIETECPECATKRTFIEPDRATRLFRLPTREIYCRLERGEIHFIENSDGCVLVCAASVAKFSAETLTAALIAGQQQ
jgi:hypothetical protein